MKGTEAQTCNCCFTSTEDCIQSRRCFMTGEYCSKQTNIQKERKRLHDKYSINAFVVMNFSNMSDVVYKWRLQSFIESLSKYLYIDSKQQKLYCLPTAKLTQEETEKIKDNRWKQVRKVNVIRSDSNPASNYVICNRVCQQLQIADLVIVDVSVENTNVFYEFGMAVALGKMILPICYSESFYEIRVPKVKESDEATGEASHKAYLSAEEYTRFWMRFWENIDEIYAGRTINIPLIGAGITRFRNGKPTKQVLLEIMLWTLKISGFHNTYADRRINFVIYPSDAAEIDFYHIQHNRNFK